MVALKPGDLVRMDYTGKLARDGAVFDTTMEDVAKQGGIYSQQVPYCPKLVVFGMGRMMEGLEEMLPTLEIGKKKEILIKCEKAFGQKDKNLIRVLSLSDFRKQNVHPVVGMTISMNGTPGIIKSISSGRVMVDFNHPLAGEDLQYSVTLLETISDSRKKLEAILSAAKVDAKVVPNGDSFDVEFNKENPTQQEIAIANAAIQSISPNASIKLKEGEDAENPEKLHSKLASKKAVSKPEPARKK
ncbi:Putative FKBP-type peptidyl-prolyl cis-trans isomerase [Candidatus Anstonella stagnisolia]|nr:Putative FKBP-type peptidyl-prolyl cis-trans isomerase [Candidatus Anstonella stagnisolia]